MVFLSLLWYFLDLLWYFPLVVVVYICITAYGLRLLSPSDIAVSLGLHLHLQ